MAFPRGTNVGDIMVWTGAGWATGAGSAVQVEYTVGPADRGNQFATLQAAVNQAVADGAGASSSSRARFVLYPSLYLETVTIPAALRYFDIQGAGGRYGTFVSSLVINRDSALGQTFWTLDQLSTGAYAVTDVGGGANTSGSMVTNCWSFGTASINMAGHTMRCYAVEFSASTTPLIFVGTRIELEGGRVDSGGSTNVAVNVNSTSLSRLENCYVFGRIVAAGGSVQLMHNMHFSEGAAAVADSCTSFSEIYGNTFHQNGASTAGFYAKTGASQMSTGGNSFGDQAIAPYFNVTAGTHLEGALTAREVASRNTPLEFYQGGPGTRWQIPQNAGTAGQVLTKGAGNTSTWATASAGAVAHQIYPRSFTSSWTSTNTIYLMKFVAPTTQTIDRVGLFIASTAAGDTVLFGIYDNALTTLLNEGSFTPSTAGWVVNAFTSGTAALTGGTEYWLAVKGTTGAAGIGGQTDGLANANNLRSIFNSGTTLPASAAAATAASNWASSFLRAA